LGKHDQLHHKVAVFLFAQHYKQTEERQPALNSDIALRNLIFSMSLQLRQSLSPKRGVKGGGNEQIQLGRVDVSGLFLQQFG